MESAECSSTPPFATPESGPLPVRGRVLHVDDDPMARMILGEWLKLHRYESRTASGPAEADRLLGQAPVDLVLSDIHMPGNCRLEWVEQVMARKNAPAVIVITGTPEFETACRAANLSVAGYLLKPVVLSDLDAIIQRVLRERRRLTDSRVLARDVLRLLETCPRPLSPTEEALADKLVLLAGCLGDTLKGPPTGSPGDVSWRAVVTDTIAVIERTKHSFRSAELGKVRLRLQQVLNAS